MHRFFVLPVLVGALAATACHREQRVPSDVGVALPAGVAALVAADRIEMATVARVSHAQAVPPGRARDAAVADALFAAAARQDLDRGRVRAAERTALARALLETLTEEARRQGAPSDAELEAATLRRWWDLDRPPMLRTTHAVVAVKKPEDDARAHAVADRIASAVSRADTPTEFRRAAKSIPGDGLTVRVEDLDPVTRDGLSLDPGAPPPPGSEAARYSRAFVDAAFAIAAVGQKSSVVRSEFGYHVILAVELLPEKRMPVEERRRSLEPEIIAERAARLRDVALAASRSQHAIELERSALDLTEKVRVAP